MIARVTCSVIGFNANNLAAFDKAALRAALSAVDHAGVPIEGFNFFDRLSNGLEIGFIKKLPAATLRAEKRRKLLLPKVL